MSLRSNHVVVSMDFSLQPLMDWWDRLQARNERARVADEIDDYSHPLMIALECFNCGADASHIAYEDTDEGSRRVCMWCSCIQR